MADNTTITSQSGGDVIRDVSKGGIKTPVSIIDIGGGGSESLLAAGQATMANSVPVALASNQSTVPVAIQSDSSVGATPYHLVSAGTTNATSVKGSAGIVYGIQLTNTNAAARYVKFYNKASAPTVGTDVPVKTLLIPGSAAGAGNNVPITHRGIAFSTGIAFAIVANMVDNDTTTISAGDVCVDLDYL